MSAASDYLEDKILEHTLGISAFTAPSTVYLALFTSDPTDAGTGTEVSTGGYTRQTISFAAVSGGSVSSNADITFGPATADYGTVGWIGVYDSSSAGNLLYHGSLSASKTIETNDSFVVESGDLTITLD